MESTVIKEDKCPHCKRAVNSVDSSDMPRPGDISVCIYCTALLMFTDDLSLRLMEEEDWNQLPEVIQLKLTMERTRLKMAKARMEASLN